MRVLLTTDAVGGVWTFTCELAVELLRRGNRVSLVSFGRTPAAHQQQWLTGTAACFGSHFAAQASDAPLEWMQDNDGAFSKGARVLLDVCDRFAPDVLHSSQFCWGALDVSIPVIVTAHSDVLSWAGACRPGGLEESAWLRRYRRLVQDGLDGAAAVTAPTAWMAAALQENFRVAAGVEVIPNGRSIPERESSRKLQAVSAGRLWDEAKGLRTLLELQSRVPVIVAGECDYPTTSTASLTFSGALSADGVLQLFSESSIYIAASLYEPFGLAPLEAALCGCAVIARDLPSLREVWGEAATYFRDVHELERLLNGFAHDPEHLEARKAAAFERARRFSARAMASAYLALYQRLLDGPPGRSCEHEAAVYAS